MKRATAAGLAAAAALLAPPGAAHEGPHAEAALPAAPALYEPPPPGSYELPPIAEVEAHTLLDEAGAPASFPALAAGQAAVISFVYGNCGEGCPLALATLQQLDRSLAANAALAARVELITVSFDPERDSPARMAELRTSLAPRSAWRFVTAPDAEALAPVLEDYGQRVVRLLDTEGADTGLLQHVLKVFLVDEFLRIRNVYSAGLMDARLILNDLQTVLAD